MLFSKPRYVLVRSWRQTIKIHFDLVKQERKLLEVI